MEKAKTLTVEEGRWQNGGRKKKNWEGGRKRGLACEE